MGFYFSELQKLLVQSNATIPKNDNEDFYGAVNAILRLQNTYNLSSQSIADGHIPGCHATTPLAADDCFEFGAAAYKLHEFTRSREWLETGIKLARRPGDDSGKLQVLLEYLAWIEFIVSVNFVNINPTKKNVLELYPVPTPYC